MRETRTTVADSTTAPPSEAHQRPDPDAVMALPLHKRMVVQRTMDRDGRPELHLYYGDQEISFDEPQLFAFGETLARQTRFRASDAIAWGRDLTWAVVQPLLGQLLEAGILTDAREQDGETADVPADGMVRPSPLPPATCPMARTWTDCAAITRDLTGLAVDPGYLEIVIPVFRVAHIYQDRDRRQVGEANVFPRALRLDTLTTWVTCAYPGTRHMSNRPMNVTALKAMRLHWKPMLTVLRHIRDAFLRRCPDARDGWTVGRIERLATMVLAVPTYQLVRTDRPVANGALHPVLSSVFRVTDGLRMTMHQMLFVPIGEPTLSPETPLTSTAIFEYAERNYAFHSETGVCGGPPHMIQQFLRVLLDGEASPDAPLDPEVRTALEDVESAFDYGFRGLRVYAAFFSLWPAMTRAYESLGQALDDAAANGAPSLAPLRDRMRGRVDAMQQGTYLATEAWRAHREQVYADMFHACGRALTEPAAPDGLAARLAAAASEDDAATAALATLAQSLRRLAPEAAPSSLTPVCRTLMRFFVQAQAILRVSVEEQAAINRLLGRPSPGRPFGAAEADVHNLLQGADVRRLPYLVDELQDALALDIVIDADRLMVTPRGGAGATAGDDDPTVGMGPASSCAATCRQEDR